MANPQQSGGSPFARYAGEQVRSIPEGYIQAMGQSPLANMIQGGMAAYNAIRGQKQKSSELEFERRKVEAAEKANKIKENSASVEQMFKAWEAGSKEYAGAGTAMKEVGASLLTQRDLLTRRLEDPDLDEGTREAIKGQLMENDANYNEHVKRLTEHYATPPPSFFEFQERARPTKAPETEPLSYAPTSGVTPKNAYGTASKDVLLGGGIGGAPKKVTVQNGLVRTVTGANGVAKELKSPIPESAIPALNEFLQTAIASDEPIMSDAEEGAPAEPAIEPPVEIGATLKGELGGSFRHWKTTSVPDKATGGQRPISGTLTLDGKSGEVLVNFDSTLLKPDSPSYAQSINRYRMLNLMADAMNSLAFDKVVPTKEESAMAIQLFSSPGVNDILMPDIARAYALVKRNTERPKGDIDTSQASAWGRRFEQRYQVFPNDYLVNGEQVDEYKLEPDASVASAKRRRELFTQLTELASNPTDIPEVYRGDNPHNEKVEAIAAEIDKLTKSSPVSPEFQKQDSLRLSKLSKALESAIALQTQWDNDKKMAIAASKRADERSENIRQEIKTTLDVEEGTLKEVKLADSAMEAVQSFVGVSKSDKEQYTGYVAENLEEVGRGVKRDIEVLGEEPRLGERPVFDSKGKVVRRVVEDKMDAGEFVKEAIKGNNFKQIITEAGRTRMPTAKQREDARTSVASYKAGVNAIIKLNESNDELVAEQRKHPVTGRVMVKLKQLTSTELNSLAEYRGQLISAIRTAMVGPGNPSNYEQEILANIVPDISQLLSSPERNKLRLKALAIGSMLAHNQRMSKSGLRLTDDTIDMFTRQFGSIVGRKITKAEFLSFADDYNQTRVYYTNQESQSGKGNSNLTKDFASRLISRLEAMEDEDNKGK